MKTTKEEIKALNPCKDGWEWYLKNQKEDLLTLLINASDENFSYSTWLFTSLMTKKQCVKIAVYSARLVLHIFENKYPGNNSPRAAIESAENWLKNPTEENREKASYDAANAANADDAAGDAACYAADAAADDAADDADDAGYAANAAYAAARAAAGAACTAAGDRKEIQIKIIKEAVKILEEK